MGKKSRLHCRETRKMRYGSAGRKSTQMVTSSTLKELTVGRRSLALAALSRSVVNPKAIGKTSCTNSAIESANLYTDKQRILTVGDGDLTFSLSLASVLGGRRITATTYDSRAEVSSKYKGVASTIQQLYVTGASVIHRVDAMSLGTYFESKDIEFDRIIFNFPHVGGSQEEDIAQNQSVLLGFFKSCQDILEPVSGEIHLSMRQTPFYDSWEYDKLARLSGLMKLRSCPFIANQYAGYTAVRTHPKERKAPSTQDALVHIYQTNIDIGEKNGLDESNDEGVSNMVKADDSSLSPKKLIKPISGKKKSNVSKAKSKKEKKLRKKALAAAAEAARLPLIKVRAGRKDTVDINMAEDICEEVLSNVSNVVDDEAESMFSKLDDQENYRKSSATKYTKPKNDIISDDMTMKDKISDDTIMKDKIHTSIKLKTNEISEIDLIDAQIKALKKTRDALKRCANISDPEKSKFDICAFNNRKSNSQNVSEEKSIRNAKEFQPNQKKKRGNRINEITALQDDIVPLTAEELVSEIYTSSTSDITQEDIDEDVAAEAALAAALAAASNRKKVESKKLKKSKRKRSGVMQIHSGVLKLQQPPKRKKRVRIRHKNVQDKKEEMKVQHSSKTKRRVSAWISKASKGTFS